MESEDVAEVERRPVVPELEVIENNDSAIVLKSEDSQSDMQVDEAPIIRKSTQKIITKTVIGNEITETKKELTQSSEILEKTDNVFLKSAEESINELPEIVEKELKEIKAYDNPQEFGSNDIHANIKTIHFSESTQKLQHETPKLKIEEVKEYEISSRQISPCIQPSDHRLEKNDYQELQNSLKEEYVTQLLQMTKLMQGSKKRVS